MRSRLLDWRARAASGATLSLDLLRRHRRALILTANALVVAASYLAAFWLRFDYSIPSRELSTALRTLPLVIAWKLVVFRWFAVDRGWWRFTGVSDLFDIVKASLVASVGTVWVVFYVFRLDGYPRTVPLLDLVLSASGLAGARVITRKLFEVLDAWRARGSHAQRRILVVGAGRHGVALVDELSRDGASGYRVVGFVDDDPAKRDSVVRGLRVLGDSSEIPRLVQELAVQEIVLAVPSAAAPDVQRIQARCEEANARYRTLPTLKDLARGQVLFEQARQVKDTDIIGRPVARRDLALPRKLVEGRRVVVTGAAGSIGSEIVRQLAELEPALLVLLDHAETPLFYLERELRGRFPALALKVLTGSIVDPEWLEVELGAVRPELVFHCAAYKHVPLMQTNVRAALRTNLLGSYRLAKLAASLDVECMVNVSTDKAVCPSTVMGLTKRLAELALKELDRIAPRTRFVSVRFGNVMDSQGSVVPIFRAQIERHEPVTVTDPEATRYFITIAEAAHLVLQAAARGKGGEIFLLDMGEPVRIGTLAEKLIRMSGFEPHREIPIRQLGLRGGEKMHERLHCPDGDRLRRIGDGLMIVESDARLPLAVEEIYALLEARLSTAALDRLPESCLVSELLPEIAGCTELRRPSRAPRPATQPPAAQEPAWTQHA
ncbi:MAG: nucleoside-diphosphate sugar epimerase/dehydratase [bacterium]